MTVILKSVSPAYGGYTVARDDKGKVVLIRGAIPGELVEVEFIDKKRDYSTARVVSVIEPSEDRVGPPCPVFGLCGGCQLQYISYERQTSMKDEVLLDSLTRIGGIEITPGPALTDLQWNYRKKAQLKVSHAGIGFFREASRDVVPFDACPLMDEGINRLVRNIRERIDVRGLSDIHITCGENPIVLLRGRDYPTSAFYAFLDAGFSGVAFNNALMAGAGHASFDLNGLKYTVSPWTFFQAHWGLNCRVSSLITDELFPLEGKRILDLYAGAGNFALSLAVLAEEVVAVEENPRAVEDGARNIGLNQIMDLRMVGSSAEKYRINKKYDVIVLDPPRPGLTNEVVKKILDNPAETIVYISCNPATLSRDLKKLKEKYDIISVRQIDFFPNTFHIESITFLHAR
ncbi:MAG: class I SAM-dependent RNA methyltransferase [Nitrospirae bacterium]|nr:class I SAM-dependent RNA methyltransferase [Nitrospirota bacterium]